MYKVDGNNLGGGGTCGNGNEEYSTPIMLQLMECDGVTPNGAPMQLLDRIAADGPLIEAPSLVLVKGTYVYSCRNARVRPLRAKSLMTTISLQVLSLL